MLTRTLSCGRECAGEGGEGSEEGNGKKRGSVRTVAIKHELLQLMQERDDATQVSSWRLWWVP